MKKITMYTTATCPFCKMQVEYFDSKKIPYERVLVDEHPERIAEMVAISGQMGVPFTVIEKDDGEKVSILGFDQKRIDEELELTL
jgi:glutaredoxin